MRAPALDCCGFARIVVSGQSAGGGLAAALTQRVFDAGGIQPAGQALFCPMLDDRTGARHELDEVNHLIWNNRSNRAGWSWYLGQPAGLPDAPPYAAAARRENLAGLPSAWISIGDIELFFDETCRYAERLTAAGVKCRLQIVPMAPHAFETFAPEASIVRELFADYYRFLCESLGMEFSPELAQKFRIGRIIGTTG